MALESFIIPQIMLKDSFNIGYHFGDIIKIEKLLKLGSAKKYVLLTISVCEVSLKSECDIC